MTNRSIIGQNIAELRKAHGLTQSELADKLGVSHQAVSQWERNETLPDIMTLPLLAKVLHTTVDTLLGMDESEIQNVAEAPTEQTEQDDFDAPGDLVYTGEQNGIGGNFSLPTTDFTYDFGGRDGSYEIAVIKDGRIVTSFIGYPDHFVRVYLNNIGGNLHSQLSVSVRENVNGNVQAGMDLDVRGTVYGRADAGMSLTIGGDVIGNANAGMSLTCGNVGGNAGAGMDLNCTGFGQPSVPGIPQIPPIPPIPQIPPIPPIPPIPEIKIPEIPTSEFPENCSFNGMNVVITGDYDGDLSTAASVTIAGCVEGDVYGTGSVTVGGDVDGDASSAQCMNIGGDVNGDVNCGGSLTVTGDMNGDISSCSGNVSIGCCLIIISSHSLLEICLSNIFVAFLPASFVFSETVVICGNVILEN